MMPTIVWAADQPPVQLAQASSAPAPAAATKTPPPVPITDADLKSVTGPKTDDLAKGDPGGTLTGSVNDIVVSDSKKGLTLADLVNMVGQNRIAINFVWTLVTGYLVMFMQAGFALVETGLCRAKNANHTMMMNFMVYGFGLFAYWVMGFALQQGGCAPNANLGELSSLNSEFTVNFIGGKSWGLFV
jgi:Amt family ammonium transporter